MNPEDRNKRIEIKRKRQGVIQEEEVLKWKG